jgi:hypothetical protein
MGWIVLMLVGTNLIRFIVSGKTTMILLIILAAAAYLLVLFYFWNIWLAVAGFVLMASRLPDLLWEIRTGESYTQQDVPKGPLHIAAGFVMWTTLPLIWYSLCETS